MLAELPGASEETVIVSAHHDSVWRGTGTIDNATGAEGVRRIAERLVDRKLPRTVVFASWAAEEIALQGSRYYVEEARMRGELDRVAGIVNLDCIGHGLYLELLVFGPVGGTDHFWFAQSDIPALSILHFPYPEYHLPEERIELIDERRLDDAVELALALVEGQLEQPVARKER